MTVHNNRSFTISLRENLMEKYVCYSAEWMQQGQKAAFMSYHSETSSRTLTLKSEDTTLRSSSTNSQPALVRSKLNELQFLKILRNLWSLSGDTP